MTDAPLFPRSMRAFARPSPTMPPRRGALRRMAIATIVAAACLHDTPAPAAPTDRWGVTRGQDGSVVEGPHGQRYLLMKKADLEPKVALPTRDLATPRPLVLPTKVDLSADQTPVRDQQGRDTCTVFAFAAAVEAAYQRKYGTSLDLSEQYFNHVMQMNRGVSPAKGIPLAETNAGSTGGGGIDINAFFMVRGGLAFPLETALPYIGDGVYQQADPGDVPYVMNLDGTHTQREIDDFNLSDVPVDYRFPFPLRTTVLPQAALDGAVYKATAVVGAAPADLGNVDWYRTQLAARHEVVIQVRCCDGNPGFGTTNVWNLPANSNGGGDGHALLLVGYDDSTQTFLVKNSWGTAWAASGYVRMSYDFVRAATTIALSVVDVADPAAGRDVANNHQLYLGRWNLDIDGLHTVLDVYGLPRVADNGLHIDRLGTLFRPDGTIVRVNGEMSGNTVDFWVDWSQPDPPIGQTTGLHFHGHLFDGDHRVMTGFATAVNGDRSAFEAVKGVDTVTGVPADHAADLASAVGVWMVNANGQAGILTIASVDPVSRAIHGTHVDDHGIARSIGGHVHPDNRSVTFTVPFAQSAQTFDGMLNAVELGVMAGEVATQGTTTGFLALRTGPPPPSRQACIAQCTSDRNACFADAHSGAARGVCLQTFSACRQACPGS